MKQPAPFVCGPFSVRKARGGYGSPDFYPVAHQGGTMRRPEVLPGQPLMGFITGNALAFMSSAEV